MARRIPLLVLLVVVLSGCSVYRVSSRDTSLAFHPPKTSGDQVLYFEKIDRPYEMIGVVSVSAERDRSRDFILEQMRREAAIMGADAITGVRESDSSGPLGLRVKYQADMVVFP
ncbi:MAG: hypothetical protein GX606_00285 [Elusimicrobia bacterium]|nr:hypothetical protein [Elusimicrobiota bacterium]